MFATNQDHYVPTGNEPVFGWWPPLKKRAVVLFAAVGGFGAALLREAAAKLVLYRSLFLWIAAAVFLLTLIVTLLLAWRIDTSWFQRIGLVLLGAVGFPVLVYGVVFALL